MASGTGKYYGKMFLAAFNKEIDYLDDAIKGSFHTNSYSPDQDTHDYADDLTNEVASGGGYTTGGFTLANKTLTYTGGTNTIKFDADDISVPSSTYTFRIVVIYDATPGSAATRPLMFYCVFDVDVSPAAATALVTFDATGIATIAVAA